MDLRRSLLIACAISVAVVASMAPPAGATFPGRNGNLLLSTDDGDGRFGSVMYSVATLNLRTAGERTTRSCLSPSPDIGDNRGCALSSPAAAPDGRIALMVTEYTGPGTGQSYLEILTARGRLLSRVPTERFDGLAWSPDGTSLVASRWYTSNPGLFLIGLDGRPRRQLVSGDVGAVDWSSRGEIAYVIGNDLFVIPVGGQPRRIAAAGYDPSWAPNGRRIAFSVSATRGSGNVVVARPDGTKARFLTRKGGTAPRWSPDGRRIAFEGGAALTRAIYTVRPDGRGMRRRAFICDQLMICSTYLAAWQPLRRRR